MKLEKDKILMKLKQLRVIIIISIVIPLLLLFQLIFHDKVASTLNKFKLLPQKETFTELYFDDPQNLPKKLLSGQAIKISFVIHNLEASDKNYPYKIYFLNNNDYFLLNEGAEIVPQNSTKTITGYYTLKDLQKKYAIYVELTGLNQSIHFYINN